MTVGSDPQVNEDLFTKIALENKLVTKYQLRKASEEQQRLEGEGTESAIGEVLITLGFLSERQHQSVVNACNYRGQRDHDKRFGRQCLRMELLDQDRIEEALSTQKAEYMKSGTVRPVADILLEEGALEDEEVQKVSSGIRERDRARALARSGKHGALKGSTTTPLADAKQERPQEDEDADLEEADLEDEDEDEDEDLSDLDDADLDDEDLSDLDDVDLDDEDLSDLDDVDLDDADLEDEDLDDEDLDDVDLDDEDLDDDEEEVQAAIESASEIHIDIDDVDLDDDDDDDEDEAEDEDDLAEVVSEVDSDVELDEQDLEDLKTMESAEEEDETASWTADAFDDRPLDRRPPSESGPVSEIPEPQRLPATRVEPAVTPMVPRPAQSARVKAALPAAQAKAVDGGRIVAGVTSGAGPVERDEGAIPGSDVFEAGVSDVGQVVHLDDTEERRSTLASTASDLSPVLQDAKTEEDLQPEKTPASTESDLGARESEVHMGPRAIAQAAARAAQKAAARREAPAAAAAEAALPKNWRSDPRVRMAFEKALHAAWEVFLQELDRSGD